MQIKCSRCGQSHIVSNPQDVLKSVNDGWRTLGNSIYCPMCTGKIRVACFDDKVISQAKIQRKVIGLENTTPDEAIDKIVEVGEAAFTETFLEGFETDADGPELTRLILAIKAGDVEGAFIALTGWSFTTLINKAREKNAEEGDN